MNEDFTNVIRSDDLVMLRKIFEKCEVFREFIAPIIQLELIVDANVIISDLIWLVKNRKNEKARTRLQELIDSETVLAQAPSILKVEISKNLSIIARKKGISIKKLKSEWQEYSKKITFKNSPSQKSNLKVNIRHPNDLPYIILQNKTGSIIYTKDKDISAMGGVTVGYTVIAHLHDYSRHAAIEYTIKYQGVVIAVISEKLAELLFNFIKSLAIQIRKIPSLVWFIACGIIIVGLLNPNTRNLIVNWTSCFSAKTKKIGLNIINFTEPFFLEHQKAKEKAIAALNAANSELQKRIYENQWITI